MTFREGNEQEGADAVSVGSLLFCETSGLPGNSTALLIAWAQYEDELPEGTRRQAAQNARDDWGRVARDFLTGEE